MHRVLERAKVYVIEAKQLRHRVLERAREPEVGEAGLAAHDLRGGIAASAADRDDDRHYTVYNRASFTLDVRVHTTRS